MSYLKILSFDEPKVDQSFVRDVTSKRQRRRPGPHCHRPRTQPRPDRRRRRVEDGETLARLKTLGVDVIQGFYTGHPMPANVIGQWITDRADRLGHTLDPPLGCPVGA
jgi:EAL domain-containing protein (putative c-di-GMP-specific phosphodiesterase class I)